MRTVQRHVHSLDDAVALLARQQHGVFSRAQLERLGVTRGALRHRLQMGRWERLSTGVFAMAGCPRTWRLHCMAATLAWGPRAVVSHRAAAALHRLPPFDRPPVELIVAPGHRRDHPAVVHRSRLDDADIDEVDAIPVTSVARTLIDLGACAPLWVVEEAFEDAARRGLVRADLIRQRLDELAARGRPGIAAIRRVLDRCAPETQSVLESRLRRVLLRGGLPEPEAQFPIRDGTTVVAVVDFAYPHALLAIEADGYRWHSGRARFEHDLRRRNAITLLGWRVVHITWADVHARPRSVVAAVRRGLAFS